MFLLLSYLLVSVRGFERVVFKIFSGNFYPLNKLLTISDYSLLYKIYL